MPSPPPITPSTVIVIGAGTMGAGIAQVAATAGWAVRLMDVDESTVRAAVESIGKRLERLVEKGRLQDDQRRSALGRLAVAGGPRDAADCHLLIEAIVEDMDVKSRVLAELVPHLPAEAIIATNTSSLSVTELGRRIDRPARTVGMHFFNPAPLMQLVEVVAGGRTDPEVVERVAGIAAAWGKRVARAADVPGFIVNHVARPYYLEAFRILEDGYATVEEIDTAMTARGGFRMGPLALTDLIGQDVNAATTRSVWQQLDHPPLLRPCPLQAQLIRDGHLGRKTGRGVYDHRGPSPVPAVQVERRPLPADPALGRAVQAFADAAVDGPVDPLPAYVLARILAALILQARHAHRRGVAGPEDIDIALRYGTNYPAGPFEWSRRIGLDRVTAVWTALDATVDDDRFAVDSD